MIFKRLLMVASLLPSAYALGQIDPGNCGLAGSTLQFCDPSGAACFTSQGKPGVCTQRVNGCQCVPTGRGRPEGKIELCHKDGKSGFYSSITVSTRALAAHLTHHGDCVVGDDVDCTRDRCDRVLGCVSVPDDTLCDDGIFCNGVESCGAAGCVAVSSCPPVGGCLVTTCDEENNRCVTTPDDSKCDDGIFCNGRETCTSTGNCVAVSACPPAIDGCVTRNALCDEENNACVDVADDSKCVDTNACNGEESCELATGLCLPGQPRDCNDDVACTLDRCDPVNGECLHTAQDAVCDDGNLCNGTEHCVDTCWCCLALQCVFPPPGEECPGEFDCQSILGCDCCLPSVCRRLPLPFFPCAGRRVCTGCVRTPSPQCDDGNDCTIDECDPDDGCFSRPRCRTDADCGTDPCVLATCTEDGCCVAVSKCPPTFGLCVNFTGQCDPSSGACLTESAPFGTPCDTSTGSTQCGANGCDGTCDEDGCVGTGASACTDGIRNGTESDVDCGGTCACCEADRLCFSNHDCCDSLCEDGVCLALFPLGSTCTGGEQCESGACVDGVCCNNDCFGACLQCNQPGSVGICTDALRGTDPRDDCPGDRVCSGFGSCILLTPLGQPCTGSNQCASGFCVDGVCCDSACAGLCRSCNLGIGPGTCNFVPMGGNPNGECPTACDGAGGCLP